MKLKNKIFTCVLVLTSGFVLADENLAPLEVAQKKYSEEENAFKKLDKFKNKKLTGEYSGEELKQYQFNLPEKVLFESYVKIEALDKVSESPREDCYQKTLELLKSKPFPFVYISENIKNEPHDFKYDYLIIKDEIATKDLQDVLSFSDQFDHAEAHHLKDNEVIMMMDCEGDPYSPTYVVSHVKDKVYTTISEQNILNDHGQVVCRVETINSYHAIDDVSAEKKNPKTIDSTKNTKTVDDNKTGLALKSTLPDKVDIKAGCQSESASGIMIFLIPMMFLVLKRRYLKDISSAKNIIFLFVLFIFGTAHSFEYQRLYIREKSTVLYKSGGFYTVPEGYSVKFSQRCLAESDKNYKQIDSFIQNSILDPGYIQIHEFGCPQVSYDYKNYSKVELMVDEVPVGINIRADVLYWSNDNPAETQYASNSGESFLNSHQYTADGEITGEPGYYYWNEIPANYSFNFAENSIDSPIGINLNSNSSTVYKFKNVRMKKWPILYYNATDIESPGNLSMTQVNSLFYLFQDYGNFKINKESSPTSKVTLYHFRTPAVGTFKKADPTTVFKIVISVSKSELTNKCSDLSRKITVKENEIKLNQQYSPIIESLSAASGAGERNVYVHYFAETEKNIGKLVDFIESNKEKYGIDGEFMVENLKAISILKGNVCLSGWDVQKVKNNQLEFSKTLENCKTSNQITALQFYLLNQLSEKIANQSQTNIPDKIYQDIKSLKESSTRSQVDLMDLKQEVADFVGRLSGEARDLCKVAIGKDNLPKTGGDDFFNPR